MSIAMERSCGRRFTPHSAEKLLDYPDFVGGFIEKIKKSARNPPTSTTLISH